MNKYLIFAALFASMTFTGCERNNENTGQVIGGITGAVIGSQFGKGSGKNVGIAIGAIAGSMVGGKIGAQMDEQDKMRQQQALNQATQAPMGQNVTWHNPETNHRGSITPIQEGYNAEGHYCRGLSQVVVIDGQESNSYHRVCYMGDNKWYLAP